jgi:octaprenyl-diphosphate synthase
MIDLKQKILESVQADLPVIEKALSENLHPQLEIVEQVARHILFSGGKRLRPLLAVLGARLCGYNGDADKSFAVIFEYLHAATLLHDDLVDGGTLRRGQPAAHTVWGNETAVLVGDFLLARSLSIAARTGKPQIIDAVAEITENMSQGEIDQLHRKGDIDLSEADYSEVIRRKTAVLFQGACKSSALFADAGEAQFKALSDYGHHLGMAFQMADDLLDYTQDSATLGKQAGADLREGKLTLPVIHALENAAPHHRRQMETVITDTDFSTADFEMLVALLNRYGGITYTRREATRHIATAKTALCDTFPASSAREVLLDIADYALVRTH